MSRPSTKSEERILKDIASGKYRDFYLVYNRKSTDDTDNQKNSIKYQKSENVRFAFREKLQIAPLTLEGFATDGIVSERHSGFKENLELTFGDGNTVQYRVERPKFHRLVQWLSKGYFKGVVILCWDRASRNKGDDTIIRKLMKANVDILFTLAQYEKTSSGALHMDIDGMFAEHHSRVTSEKVTITKRSLREQGVCTYKAPVGYLNTGDMYHKPLDPVRAPIIKELFEMAATGQWSLHDLARWAIQQGFTMPPVRRRRTEEETLAEEEDDMRLEIEAVSRLPTFNGIHKMLTNRFYTGRLPNNEGVWIPSVSHEALVADELFDRVQGQLQKKNKSAHYEQFLNHPLRGFAYCAICGRVYTPYPKKGIMYYSARCKTGCANSLKSFNFDYISEKIGGLIERLSFTDEEIAEINARASTDIAILDTKRVNQIELNERRKRKIREDLAYLNANRLMLLKSGAYTPEKLVAEETTLNHELVALSEAEIASDVSMQETIKDVVKLSELLENAAVVYSLAEPEEKEKIIRVIFSELTLSQNTLEYKCKKGFAALQSRFIPSHDPTGNRTPVLALRRPRPSR
jgi:site-specific DNA recombinase